MSMAYPNLPALVSGGSLDAYVAQVNRLPILSREEEFALARSWQEEGNLEAAQKLVLSQLRYVVRVAKGYMGYGLPLADLVQEGSVGLMKAVKRFDPAMNVRLVSFAVHWIKSEIHEYIIKNWRIVKIATTKAQRKLFFNLRKHKSRLGWFSKEEVESVAEDLGVKTQEVLEMERRLDNYDMAFDAPAYEDESDQLSLPSPSERLASAERDPAEALSQTSYELDSRAAIFNGLGLLDARSRDIVQSRWLTEPKETLETLSVRHGVSKERIRQLEQAALTQLKTHLGTLAE